MSKKFFVPLLLMVFVPVFAAAQTTERPPRPYRGLFGGGPPPDPNRTHQELTLTLSGGGGYDSWISPGGGVGPVDPSQERQSGFVREGRSLNYRRGRAARAVSLEGAGLRPPIRIMDPLIGGSFQATFDSSLGRQSRFQAAHLTSYQPTLIIGAFGPLAADVPSAVLPETGSRPGCRNSDR